METKDADSEGRQKRRTQVLQQWHMDSEDAFIPLTRLLSQSKIDSLASYLLFIDWLHCITLHKKIASA